jgi:hypothetical protein
MEKIGNQQIWSYFDERHRARPAKNQAINRDNVLLFRGQRRDYRTVKKNSMLKASIFRLEGKKPPTDTVVAKRFDKLRMAEDQLLHRYSSQGFLGIDRLS